MTSNDAILRLLQSLQPSDKANYLRQRLQSLATEIHWPQEPLSYRNRETGRTYRPHHSEEWDALTNRSARYILAKGGEGGGKTVFGLVRDFEFLKLGCDGILASPDLPHFKKALWPEFRRWCPWECVVPQHRRMANPEWSPNAAFTIVFINGATLYCGGMENPMSWEGPNVSFAHLDEARRAPTSAALKVLDGRVRIPKHLPGGVLQPQMWLTTTPRKNWLYEYFGPWEEQRDDDGGVIEDPYAEFKHDSLVVTLRTEDNESAGNLAVGYTRKRAQSLTEAEARVLLGAEWEDIDDAVRFLPSMLLWSACEDRDAIVVKEKEWPMIMVADAAVSGDTFGILAVCRDRRDKDKVVVQYEKEWRPAKRKALDYGAPGGPEEYIRQMCQRHNVVNLVYDPYQMHDMATRLAREGVVWTRPFTQGADRLESDKQLRDAIVSRRVLHHGQPALWRHIDNADIKPDPETRKLRIVKRAQSLKVDLAVCLSMGNYECLRLDL